jgi:hypothetical protein
MHIKYTTTLTSENLCQLIVQLGGSSAADLAVAAALAAPHCDGVELNVCLHAFVVVCMFICIYTQTYVRMLACHACKHARMHACAHTRSHAHINARTQARKHAGTHARAHAHAHTHPHTHNTHTHNTQVGCPQRCARQGAYGAFLMDKRDVLRQAVEAMAAAIQYKFSKKKISALVSFL